MVKKCLLLILIHFISFFIFYFTLYHFLYLYNFRLSSTICVQFATKLLLVQLEDQAEKMWLFTLIMLQTLVHFLEKSCGNKRKNTNYCLQLRAFVYKPMNIFTHLCTHVGMETAERFIARF